MWKCCCCAVDNSSSLCNEKKEKNEKVRLCACFKKESPCSFCVKAAIFSSWIFQLTCKQVHVMTAGSQ